MAYSNLFIFFIYLYIYLLFVFSLVWLQSEKENKYILKNNFIFCELT